MKKRSFVRRAVALFLCVGILAGSTPKRIYAEEYDGLTVTTDLSSDAVVVQVEEPKQEAPKAEEPKQEAPKVEEPKQEAPKVEEPKQEAPKVEEPKQEAPKAEEPKQEETPKAEEPKQEEAPKVEEPKQEEAPKVEEPKQEEAPKAEEPKQEEAPKAEEPKQEETPKAEEPKQEEAPKAEEPKQEEAPKAEEPKQEETPKTEGPTVEPTVEATVEPTVEATVEPIVEPTVEATVEPTVEPTVEATVEPTVEATVEPTVEATVEPTVEPIVEPTVEATVEPTVEPTVEVTAEPTVEPTVEPIEVFEICIRFMDNDGNDLCDRYRTEVNAGESFGGYDLPTFDGYKLFSIKNATNGKTTKKVSEFKDFLIIGCVDCDVDFYVYYKATEKENDEDLIFEPTVEPTIEVTVEPTVEATVEPTVEPTIETTIEPTVEPTIEATVEPTVEPTIEATVEPTVEPTIVPELEDEELEIYNMMLMMGAYDVMLNSLGETVYAVVCDGTLIGKYVPGETVTLTVPTKEGYDFNGWKVVCSEPVSISNNQFTMPNASVGVVSSWKAQTHQVAIYYVTESGTRLYDASLSTVLNGSNFSLSDSYAIPKIDGYAVREIKHNGTTYTNTSDYRSIISVDNVTKDEVFYVVYEPANVTYTVKINLQDLDGKYYEQEKVSENGKFGDKVVASSFVKSFVGFTWNGEEDEIVLSSNNESNVVNLYYTRNSYKLSYQKDEDTDTITVKYGDTVNTSTLGTPTRVGYTFAYWTYVNGTQVPATFEMPAHDVTLVASWAPANVSYTIYYWQETLASANNLNEVEGYDFVESSTDTAVTGTPVSGSDDKSYTGFTFDHADKNVVVNADGSTVVNVYYKRSWYKYNFYVREERNDRLIKTLDYKYGANLAVSPYEWPSYTGYHWQMSDNNPYGCPRLAIEGKNVNLYRAANRISITLYGWYEDGSYAELNTWNGSSNSWSDWTSSQRYTPEGYTAYFYGTNRVIPENNGSGVSPSTKNNLYGYHVSLKKNSYTLTLNNGESDIGSHSYMYGDSIANALSDIGITEITPPTAYTGYTFAGWTWQHQSYSLEGKTMPASNMILVASWQAPVYTVNFYDDETKVTLIHYEEVERGKTVVNNPANPVKENKEFAGWFYLDDGIEKLYVEGKIINSSIDVYAKWFTSDEIKVNVTVLHNYFEADGTAIKTEQDVVIGIVGKSLTVNARSENGFYPDVLSQNILVNETENVVTFNYVKMDKMPYTVHYVDAEGNKLIPDKVAESDKLILVEEYVYIPNATPRVLAQELRLTSNPANNVITFVYDVDGTASYTIKYWQEQLDGTYLEVETDRIVVDNIRYYTQVFVTDEQKKTYTGYNFNEAISNLSDWLMPDETIVLNLYYDLQEFTVTYKYSSVIDGATMPTLPVAQTYKYGATVDVYSNALSIEGMPQYAFNGWYREGDAVETAIESFVMPNEDVVLYGYFTLKDYYITVSWTKEDGVYHGGTYAWDCDKLEYVHDTTAAGWSTEPYVKCVVKNLGVYAVNLDFSATTDKWDAYFAANSNPFKNISTVRLEGGAEYVFEFKNDEELKWNYDKLNEEAMNVALGVTSTEETNSFKLNIFDAE